MFVRPTWAEIDLDKIAHNIGEIKRLLPPGTKLMAVVKADGYGHGAVHVARKALACGSSCLAVASADEGIELRAHGIKEPILVLGFTPPGRAEDVIEHDLTQTVYQRDLLHALNRAALAAGRIAPVHVKIDSGMGRLGLTEAEEAARFLLEASELPGIEVEGLYSHFATADELDESYVHEQIERWQAVLEKVGRCGIEIPVVHISNSAAILQHPQCAGNMVRLGISMYGYYPSDDIRQGQANLQPALRLVTQIAHLKDVPAGTKISYGATFETKRASKIATLPVGYADGYSRSLSNKGHVAVRGRRAPVVGRVCMDQIMIDVTDIPGVQVYDEVVLYGKQGEEEVTVDEVAAQIGTISYEVVCDLGRRVPRCYLEQGRVVATRTP